jgi:TetR/AcrR family tetracycline transcriptional repressor
VALSRDEIVDAAVAMVDEQGLAGLSLRALAGRLGVSAPTLYWHVRDKRHLLDLVGERVLADFVPGERSEPRPGEEVADWLADVARQQRAAMRAHRDSPLVVAGNRPTAEALPGIERTLRVLVAEGLEPGEAVRVLTALGSFVVGEVLEEQAAAERSEPAGTDPAGTDPRPADWAERWPCTAAATATVGGDDERFEEGLALMLDGLRARLAARRGGGQAGCGCRSEA